MAGLRIVVAMGGGLDRIGTEAAFTLIARESEMGRLIRARDWTNSLGPVEGWPTSLKTAVNLMLHSPVALVLLWGADGIMLYNDAYAAFAGKRHPGILGCKVLDAWPEAADLNAHVMDVGMAGGSLEYRDLELVLNRRGQPEAGWMDLFYSPVIAEDGKPGGVIAVVVETTDRVLTRREAVAQSARLAQLFQDAPSFMAQLQGPDHAFAFTNSAYQHLIADRDVIGMTVRNGLPEIAGQGYLELLDRVYQTGENFLGRAQPVTLIHQPGAPPEERLLDFIFQPVRDAAGNVTGIFVEGMDVTERERATAALRANEARLRFLDALSLETAQSRDADAVLAATTRMLGERLDVSICAYADMDPDESAFTIRGNWTAPGLPSIVGRYRLGDFGRKAVADLRSGDPLIIHDARRELSGSVADSFAKLGVSATICIPLVKDGRLTALMAVHHHTPRDWSEDELALLREVTERSWAHIERVRSEAERQDSAERLQLAAAAAQIGTFDFNPVTGALKWDERCRALFALPRDVEPTYEIFLSQLHPDDRERVEQAVRDALDPDLAQAYDIECRVIGPGNGGERWIAASAHAVFHNRTAVRFVGTVLDISAKKRSEALIRASELQFRTMAEAMPNHVWTATPDGMLDWFNDQVYAFSGAPRGTLDGGGWATLVHPDDLPRAQTRWGDALDTSVTYETEFRLRRADGRWRWHITRAVPIKDANGKVARWIGSNTDIEDQKEVAAALSDINAVLEQRVAERTGQLQDAEAALRQAQKMEAVGQLTGGLAHDFNNLLQGITGALDRVQMRIASGRPEEAERFVKLALDGASRAAALTHRLLAFSRRQTLDARPTDVNRLIGGMEDLLNRTMGPQISIEVVGSLSLWAVLVDPSQLENSVLNLCINARDAMPDGGRLILETTNKWLDERTARERDLKPGQYVQLCVSDTGAGMTPEVISRAFDPFFTTKPIGSGTGLGLSMVYGFVRQSGGQIRIYSEENAGSTVCLYFPRHAGAAEKDIESPIETIESGFGETVLLVDDDRTVRTLIADVLNENRYRVIEAGDGPSALEILESRQKIELMVTDVGLPGGMNGGQLADAARGLRTDLKVLFITGYAESAAIGAGRLAPGMAILAKPFAMATLANKVREILERTNA